LHVLKFLDLSDLLGRFACVSAASEALAVRVVGLIESAEIVDRSKAYEEGFAVLGQKGRLVGLHTLKLRCWHSYRFVKTLMKHCPTLVHVSMEWANTVCARVTGMCA